MSDTERSFADRLQRGRELQAAAAGFSPGFDPADVELVPATFLLFLEDLNGLNIAVAGAAAEWQDTAATRTALVENIKARALRASSRVKSNSAWKMQLPAVKSAADNLRGYRTPKPKPPADAPPPRTRREPARKATRATAISRR